MARSAVNVFPASWLLGLCQIVILVFLLSEKYSASSSGSDLAGHTAIGAFELAGAAVSLHLLSQGTAGCALPVDWLVASFAAFFAAIGFPAYSVTLLALFLVFRDRSDAYTKAAGTVVLAVAMQAAWAPLIFAKLSFFFLEIDAGIVGWLLAYVVPGASSSGAIVTNPSGHDVIITAACASFHNLSLASLCWVTLTMLHRPYWIKADLYVGLGAMLIQFALNLWRLVFVCISPSMYDFWHEGLGKHIFSAVATACAIVFVQLLLARMDQKASCRSGGIPRTENV